MNTSRYKNRFYFVRQIIMVGLIACLCISTSEGLRLAPFPSFELIEIETTKKQLRSNNSHEITNKYNPTTVPTRPMRRSKQHVVHYESLPSQNTGKLAVQPVFMPVTGAATDFVSPLLSLSIPSRAPPLSRSLSAPATYTTDPCATSLNVDRFVTPSPNQSGNQ